MAGALLLGGCGLSENGEPQAIPPGNLPPELLDPDPSSSTSVPGAGTPVAIYLLASDGEVERLVAVPREIPELDEPGQRVDAVLRPLTEAEVDGGFSTFIPGDTVLLDTELDQETGIVTVNLSNELFSVEGESLSKAFAQIVYSVFEDERVREVRFRRDGETIQAQDDGGAGRDTVTKADYRAFAPE